MPAIPALNLPATGDVLVADIYADSVYAPAVTPDTLGDVLNGGLDGSNYAAGDNSIPAHAVQSGVFARGWSTGWTRWEYHYARQLGNDSNENNRIIISGLAMRVKLPWEASILLYGYEAWCQQDAMQWDYDGSGGGPFTEFWDIRFNAAGTVQQAMYAKLPHSRRTTAIPSGGATGISAAENRFKWVNKQGMSLAVPCGYRTVRCEAWTSIEAPDPEKAKLKIPTGMIWMLAVR